MPPVRWLVIAALLSGALPARAADDVDAAREHYKRASRLYDLRRFKEAAKEFEAAYVAKDDTAFLYNIAQSYRLAGEPAEAMGAYKSYLRRAPDAPQRKEVEQRIAELEHLVAQQQKAQETPPNGTHPPELPEKPVEQPPPKPAPVEQPAAPPPHEPEAPAAGRLKLIAGAVVAAAGLALVGVGIGFAVLTQQASDQLSNPQPGSTFDPGLESAGRTDQAIAIATLAVGGAAVAAGAVVLGLGVAERRAPRGSPQISIAPSLRGFALAGVF